MGYSHYIRRPRELDRERFMSFKEDVRKLYHNLPEHSSSAGAYYMGEPLEIRGTDGKGQPIISVDGICFNGDADNNMDCETFNIPRVIRKVDEFSQVDDKGLHFDFCKTSRKPYDLLVCATLMALKHHFGGKVKVSSDGEQDDWKPANEFYEKTLKRKSPKKFRTIKVQSV